MTRLLFACWLSLLGPLLSGCGGSETLDPINPKQPYQFPGAAPSGDPSQPAVEPTGNDASALRIGERISITFSDIPPPGLPPHEQRVREDGTITLPFNVTVQAAGKTARELESDIRTNYVPRLYLRMTVTVKSEERFFYVGGEVRVPGRQAYVGYMSVLRAVQSAGDFTDFANRKKIDLIRSNGKKHRINWHKAIQDSSQDLEVYPGDQVIVRKRFW